MFTNNVFEHLIAYAGGKESGIEPHIRQSGDVIIHILEAIHSAEVSQDNFQIREPFCNLSRRLREAMYQVGGERVIACVKNDDQAQLLTFFIYWKHFFIFDKELLIVRMKFYAFQSECFYSFKLV